MVVFLLPVSDADDCAMIDRRRRPIKYPDSTPMHCLRLREALVASSPGSPDSLEIEQSTLATSRRIAVSSLRMRAASGLLAIDKEPRLQNEMDRCLVRPADPITANGERAGSQP